MTRFARCIVSTLVAVVAITAPAVAAMRIDVLSNRADLISGGDALVAIGGSASQLQQVRVTSNGADVTKAFASRPDGRFEGLVTGLRDGANTLKAQLPDGSGATETITNHPSGGPVFSGPQIQPWVCGTAAAGLGDPTDAQCDAPAKVSYQYKSSANGQFSAYDPSNPPSDVATTTTDQGRTVPYVVRVEEGAQDRGLYELAVLADPKKPFEPWSAQQPWNHKLVVPFGGSTAPHHSQDAPSSVMDDLALSRGFMVANSGLNIQGSDANANVSAEALMMLEEHIREAYGPIRYTIGNGCSGGGLQQYMIASMYPGLLDGIQPNCSFADMWSTAPDVGECHGIIRYFQNNPNEPWVPGLDGHKDPSDCEAWDATFWPVTDPTRASNCNLPQSQVYDPNTNPEGARCTLEDYQIDVWGRQDPSEWGPVEKKLGHGFAARPVDNVGVQYGLQSLKKGSITPAEFADLNAKAGGFDIDGNPTTARDVVSEKTASIAYRTGQITDARQLDDIPIIDLRGYSETSEIHTSVYSYVMRARLDKANGDHANQVIWTWQAAFPILGMAVQFAPQIEQKSFLLIDGWLAKLEADHRDVSQAQKVRQDKPSDAVDGCFAGNGGSEITDMSQCAQLYPRYDNTRTSSGEPLTANVVKCRLKPLTRADYPGVTFSDAEWALLQQAFPTGVCDYSKPGVGQQASIPWMSFQAGPGGQPLGTAPSSSPLTARGMRACTSRRRVVFHVPRGARSVRVLVGGRARKVAIRRRAFAIALNGLPRSAVRVTITSRVHGRKVVRRSTLHPCSKRA